MSIDVVPVESAGAVAAERTGPSPRGELVREIVRSKTFIVGAIIVGFWIVCAIFGYLIAPDSPTAQNLGAINQAPSSAHWFGTDQIGRDVLSRVIVGARTILIIAPLATLLGTVLGTALGLAMGYLGGVLDAASSEKGARFVSKCDAFGIPLVVLVDTPGYMPGTRQEGAGVIRHGASLVHAFAQATVPRVTVILRKAFGGAYITMNSKDLGADYVFAWPGAEIGVMGAKPAVGVMHRRELAVAEDPEAERERLAQHYAESQLRPQVAASTGYIDELISPYDTRARLVWALDSLRGAL